MGKYVIIAIEAATSACSVALQAGGEIYQKHLIAPQKHAELLLPMIDTVLKEANLSLQQVDAIAFGCGPGSFMGVRTATGIAQGLAFGANLPLIPVSTMQTLAQTAYEKTSAKNMLVAWDARMDAIYWGAYTIENHPIMQPIQPDQLSLPENIAPPENWDFVAVGNAWQAYSQQLSHWLVNKKTQIDIYPEAQEMLKIADYFYRTGKCIDPVHAKPVYLRDRVAN
jgi:tRNA threonylcarbamoyladenosine biosynthesis protein TsaB